MKRMLFGFAALAFVIAAGTAVAGQPAVIPNSLHDAKVGEWALYKTEDGYNQKHSVIKVEGAGPAAKVTVRIDNIYDGQLVNSTEVYHEAGETNHPFVPSQLSGKIKSIDVKPTNVTIKGKTVNAVIVRLVEDDDDDTMEWYLSEDIPVFGMIKQIEDDDLEYDLIDYGVN